MRADLTTTTLIVFGNPKGRNTPDGRFPLAALDLPLKLLRVGRG